MEQVSHKGQGPEGLHVLRRTQINNDDTDHAPTEDEETISLGLLSRHDQGMAKDLPTANEGAERIR